MRVLTLITPLILLQRYVFSIPQATSLLSGPRLYNGFKVTTALGDDDDDDDDYAYSCAKSWFSWAETTSSWLVQQHNSMAEVWDRSFSTVTNTIGIASRYTECDGIPRVRLAGSPIIDWTTQSWYTGPSSLPSHSLYPGPVPTCSLKPVPCQRYWQFLADKYHDDVLFPLEDYFMNIKENGTDKNFFGCPIPQAICRAQHVLPGPTPTTEYKGGCTLDIGRVAVVAWPVNIVSSDLCKNDGHGSYQYATSQAHTGPPVVFSTSALTILARNQITSGRKPFGNLLTDITITGNFVFTSPTVYLAHDSITVRDRCSTIGSIRPAGVVPLRKEQISSLAYKQRPIDWDGTDLELIHAMAKFTPKLSLDGWYTEPLTVNQTKTYSAWHSVYETQPYNFAHHGKIPAAVYFQQGHCGWWDFEKGRCHEIIEDYYYPDIILPSTGIFTNLGPGLNTCYMEWEIHDPVIVISRAEALATPIAPAIPNLAPPPTPQAVAESGPIRTDPAAIMAGSDSQPEHGLAVPHMPQPFGSDPEAAQATGLYRTGPAATKIKSASDQDPANTAYQLDPNAPNLPIPSRPFPANGPGKTAQPGKATQAISGPVMPVDSKGLPFRLGTALTELLMPQSLAGMSPTGRVDGSRGEGSDAHKLNSGSREEGAPNKETVHRTLDTEGRSQDSDDGTTGTDRGTHGSPTKKIPPKNGHGVVLHASFSRTVFAAMFSIVWSYVLAFTRRYVLAS